MRTPAYLVLLFILIQSPVAAQQLGFSAALSLEKAVSLNLMYGPRNTRLHLGASLQFNGQELKVIDERNEADGFVLFATGNYFQTIDVGISQVLANGITLYGEYSFVTDKIFSSYQDESDLDDTYSLINAKARSGGYGLSIGHMPTPYFEFFAGYHTVKKISVGMRYVLRFDRN